MRKKRRTGTTTTKATRGTSKHELDGEKEFYIPYARPDAADFTPGQSASSSSRHYDLRDVKGDAMDDAVLDLLGDDEQTVRRSTGVSRSEYVWDKSKKRYIKLQKAESVTASGKRIHKVRNEAGVYVVGAGTGAGGKSSTKKVVSAYQEWMKKTHQRVTATGAVEESGGEGRARAAGTTAGSRQKFGRERVKQKSTSTTSTTGGQSLRNPDQVRKERAEKEKKMMMMAGGRGGRGSGSGRGRGRGRGRRKEGAYRRL